jgi:predicted ribosomally synthesized peptide with SipW-like signal peptide
VRPRTIAVYAGVAAFGLLLGLAARPTYAAFTATTQTTSPLTAAPDWVAPTTSSSVIGKTTGGETGFVHVLGTYYIYAQVTDTGNPASGVTSVTADVSSMTAGATAVPLVAGSYSVFGQTFNYRSASQTVPSTATNASYAYSLSMTDGAGNSRTTTGFSVATDNVGPTTVDLQTANVTGTAGRPDLGDTVTYVFGDVIDLWSVLSGWTGGTINVVVRINDGGGTTSDKLVVYDSTNTTQLPLGTLDLINSNYVTSNVTFGVTGTPSTIQRSGNNLIVTLGTPSATCGTGNQAKIKWTPGSTMTNRGGYAVPTTTFTQANNAVPF